MRHLNRHWCSIIVLIVSLLTSSSAQNTPDIVKLDEGKPIERELVAGEVHSYSIQLKAGEFLKVIVDQRGIDVVLTAFEPDGKQIARVDGPGGSQGPETVLIVADTSGSYRLEVRSVEEMARAGRYEVKIDTLRATIAEDKKLIEIFDTDNRASAQVYIGYVQQQKNNYAEALEAYRKSIPLSEATGNKKQLALTLSYMGQTNRVQGNYPAALECYQKSLKLGEDLGNKAWVANTLSSISLVYRNIGNFGQALDSAQRSLTVLESLGRKLGAADAQMSIGLVYGSMGDNARALEHYRTSLALAEELGNKRLIANALDKIAGAFNAPGDYPQALEYAQTALKLNEEIKNYRGTIFSMVTLGKIHQRRGEYAQALEYFQKALALSETVGDKQSVAESLMWIGYIQLSQSHYPQAVDAGQRATTIARQIGNRQMLLNALNNTAHSYLSLNQLENARGASEEAVGIVEFLRASVAGNEARTDYFASARYPYELSVDVLMQLHKQRPTEGYDAAALQISERGRARSLLEALNEARADIRQGVDQTLLISERTLQQRLNATAESQMRILSSKHTEEQAVRLRAEIDALTSDYQGVEAQIRQSSPRYAALTQPMPLTVSEIQNKVLDSDTALLEYALGDDHSYLWVVTTTFIKSFQLPKRVEIETSVRQVIKLLSDGKRWTTSAQINTEYSVAADQLSRTLLPSALMSLLKAKRLVIVGDGAVEYLPFGALPSPTSKVEAPKSTNGSQVSGQWQPLIADYEIVSLPSASTLAVLRREMANRARPTKSVAVLADPVFEKTDERVQQATAKVRQVGNSKPATSRDTDFDQLINSRALLRALDYKSNDDAGGAGLEQLHIARLPFTRFEAESILASAPKGQNLKAIDFRANRETATSAELSQYRFVHFATHGILNSEHPELSGIVLSMVDEHGQPANGFLRLNEIYNLNLPADLVVLSACQTGLGKDIRGEGLVGLTRGFMYAGAPRVVASLWKVDDAATAELMKRFYQGMLKDNLRPAAALRAAKIEMWKQKRWNAPFYWAAFELQGEWK